MSPAENDFPHYKKLVHSQIAVASCPQSFEDSVTSHLCPELEHVLNNDVATVGEATCNESVGDGLDRPCQLAEEQDLGSLQLEQGLYAPWKEHNSKPVNWSSKSVYPSIGCVFDQLLSQFSDF